MLLWKKLNKHCTIASCDGTPDVSHTEQITFILRYVNLNEEVWEICERFLTMEDCDKKKGRDIA